MKPKIINLHIDRLVIDGVGDVNRKNLSAAIQTELSRLITTQGLHSSLHQSGAIEQINAKPISLTGQIRERSLGNKIAGSVYRGMKL